MFVEDITMKKNEQGRSMKNKEEKHREKLS